MGGEIQSNGLTDTVNLTYMYVDNGRWTIHNDYNRRASLDSRAV